MRALIRKEIRLLLPWWIVALVAMAGANLAFRWPQSSPWLPVSLMVVSYVAVALVGVSSLGGELRTGSLGFLLVQPISRQRTWWVKSRCLILVLASTLGLAALVPWGLTGEALDLSGMSPRALFAIWTAWHVATVCTALWTAVLARQESVSIWLSLGIPLAIASSVWMLPDSRHDLWIGKVWGIAVALAGYSVAAFLWGWRLFLRAEDVPWTGGAIAVPRFIRPARVRERPRAAPCYRPLRALFWKELQLSQAHLLLAGGVLILHVACLVLRGISVDWRSARDLRTVCQLAPLLWLVFPWLIGGTAVAEERKLGTVEAALCLPFARRWQFLVKALVALGLGVLLGGVLPWAVVAVDDGLVQDPAIQSWRWFLEAISFAAVVAAVSFYASTVARSTLEALGLAVVFGVVVGCLVRLAVVPPAGVGFVPWSAGVASSIGGPALLGVLAVLAYRNAKRIHEGRRLWSRNLVVFLAAIGLWALSSTFVYHRAWEFFTALEPTHGPARIAGPGKTKIVNDLACVFILLPDGRLWVTKDQATEILVNAWPVYVPTNGGFVGAANWVDVATFFYNGQQIVGIQRDGSLWHIAAVSRAPREERPADGENASLRPDEWPIVIDLHRIGMDSDWKALAGDWLHCLLLKQDGSLWCLGANLCSTETPRDQPARFGHERDWASVFVGDRSYWGVKQDGSLWRWGGQSYLDEPCEPEPRPEDAESEGTEEDEERIQAAPESYEVSTRHEPIRWSLLGHDLVGLQSGMARNRIFVLGLYGDGSIRAAGMVPPGLLGDPVPQDQPPRWVFHKEPVRVGAQREWRDISLGDQLLAIAGDGSLWRQDLRTERAMPLVNVSKYSDWIAVRACDPLFFALAADGTVCCWVWDKNPMPDSRGFRLTPSRRPLWSLNILEASE